MANHYEHEDEDGFSTSGLPASQESDKARSIFRLLADLSFPAELEKYLPVRNTDYEKLFLTAEDKIFLKSLAVSA